MTASKKAPAAQEKKVKAPKAQSSTTNKRHKKRVETFAIYIFKVLK